jgi:hypothetical protein
MIKKKKTPKPRNPLALHGLRRRVWIRSEQKELKRQKDKDRKELNDRIDE